MEYTIVNELKSNDLFKLRNVLGWKTICEKQLDKAIENTMCKVSIFDNETIIACGRLVGDYSCKGVLSDILVHPNYQNRGLGKIVVTNLIEQVKDYLDNDEMFQIEATPTAGNREFYIKCGLKYKPENQDGVYIWITK